MTPDGLGVQAQIAVQKAQPTYDTPIPPERQKDYHKWLQSLPANLRGGTSDYDMQGAFLGGAKPSKNAHLTDEYKKPNHYTFSTESKYSGKNGLVGGKWVEGPDKTWTFYASPTNLKYHTAQELQDYFQKYEPGYKLVLPGAK